MNFVKLYIGDYQRDTGHLSIAEHGAYMLMLQHYYATERPLPTGRGLYRLLRAETKDDRAAIDSVVKQFWTEDAAGLINSRAVDEIRKAEHQRTVNREIGRRGGRPIRTEPETESVIESDTEPETESVSGPEPNRNPNQTPDTRHQKKKKTGARAPGVGLDEMVADGVPEDVAAAFLGNRTKQRAPLTRIAWDGIKREAAKAGWTLGAAVRKSVERGWRGFEAEWVAGKSAAAQPAWRAGPNTL